MANGNHTPDYETGKTSKAAEKEESFRMGVRQSQAGEDPAAMRVQMQLMTKEKGK